MLSDSPTFEATHLFLFQKFHVILDVEPLRSWKLTPYIQPPWGSHPSSQQELWCGKSLLTGKRHVPPKVNTNASVLVCFSNNCCPLLNKRLVTECRNNTWNTLPFIKKLLPLCRNTPLVIPFTHYAFKPRVFHPQFGHKVWKDDIACYPVEVCLLGAFTCFFLIGATLFKGVDVKQFLNWIVLNDGTCWWPSVSLKLNTKQITALLKWH